MSEPVKKQMTAFIEKMIDAKKCFESFYGMKYCLERYEEYRQGLFNYAPFQIGDFK